MRGHGSTTIQQMQITGFRQRSACSLISRNGSRKLHLPKMNGTRSKQYLASSQLQTQLLRIILSSQRTDTSQVRKFACISSGKHMRRLFTHTRTSTLLSHLVWMNQRFSTCTVNAMQSTTRQTLSSHSMMASSIKTLRRARLRMTRSFWRTCVSSHSSLRAFSSTVHLRSCLVFSVSTNLPALQSKFSTSCAMSQCTSTLVVS